MRTPPPFVRQNTDPSSSRGRTRTVHFPLADEKPPERPGKRQKKTHESSEDDSLIQLLDA